MAGAGSPSLLLALPDPCLLAVLQCLAADDQRSLLSAARSHSRLHQAAVAALHSITAHITEQQQMDSVLLYLDKHGQHVDSIQLTGVERGFIKLPHLPQNLQLSSLQLEHLHVQLEPRNGSHVLLGAATVAALKQLCLKDCKLRRDGKKQLAATLSQLPAALEHLSINHVLANGMWVAISTEVLQRLQQLTYLELARCSLKGPDQGQPALQPLQALTLLQDLRICTESGNITASMLSGTHRLTRLKVSGYREISLQLSVEPQVLASKTQLQHLQLAVCMVSGGVAGAAQLLSHLQPLQQLTHLDLAHISWALQEGAPPQEAAPFLSVTASSKLQRLDLHKCRLAPGVWQHIFPAGRQLPHVRCLDMSWVIQPNGTPTSPPDFIPVVSCCPCLQSLDMMEVPHSADQLTALLGLSALHTLRLSADECMGTDGLNGLCQLTGLRKLQVSAPYDAPEEWLLQLTPCDSSSS